MKKILVVLLTVAMMATLLVSVSAVKPTEYAVSFVTRVAPQTRGELAADVAMLKTTSTVPTATLITEGLDFADIHSANSLTETWKESTFTASQKADIGNYKKYGASGIGFDAISRSMSSLIDGYWNSGNTGDSYSDNGQKKYGAFEFTTDNLYYNYLGESATKIDETHVYQFIITLNFKKIANIASFGFANNLNNLPQAADIYISNDGVTWTLVGWYDRPLSRLNSDDFTAIGSESLGNDKTGGTESKKAIVFEMPANTTAQFLRVCAISGNGKTTPENINTYDDYVNTNKGTNVSESYREMFVWGSLTDQVGYTYNPEEETTIAEEETTAGPEEQSTSGTVIIKPGKKTEAPTEAPTSPDNAKTEVSGDTEKRGCGATVGTLAVLATLALVPFAFKKKED